MRYVFGTMLLVGLGLGAYQWRIFGMNERPQQNTPLVVHVERGLLQITVESTGTVEPEREVEIKCEASGEITGLPVDVSDIVKKDDLLVQLDPRDEELLVKRTQADLIVSKAKLEQAKLALKIAEQDLENARSRATATLASAEALAREKAAELERTLGLYDKKVVSKQALESSQTTHAQASTNLETARISLRELATRELHINSLRQNVRISGQDVVTSEIDLDDAQERLRETTVRSPMNGVVTVRNVQVGQIISSGTSSVNGGTTVLYLADMSRMYVLVSVDESDIGSIRKGQDVRVTVDAFPKKAFQGTVVRVASKGISSSNVVTFQVKVEITSPDKNLLKPGMTANVAILIVDKNNVLRVLSEAVQQTSKSCSVTILNADKTMSRRDIAIGESTGEWTEVLSGLHEGEQLVVTQRNQGLWRSGETESKNGISSNLLGTGQMKGQRVGPGGPPK